MKKIMAILVCAVCAVLVLGGCGKSADSGNSPAAQAGPVVTPEETAGFEEFPIGDDIELGPLNVAGVYFQPVDMLPAGNSLPAAQADMHMEADISALANELGYGVGDFVPNLTVSYEITKEDGWRTEGTFMPMNASDGPHYGANLKLNDAGTYKVRFIIQNPEAQGFLLHVDQETGVPGRFWEAPLVAEWDFDFVPRVW
jgi:uncharacterized protein involved in high-affinity Fe2+ transport